MGMAGGRLMTVAEVAARVRTTPATVRRWLREGKLRGLMPGGTKLGYRVTEAELDRFLGTQEQAPKLNEAA